MSRETSDRLNEPSPGRIRIDREQWERRTLFDFFNGFEEPYHGICVRVECTAAYAFAKDKRLSVFLTLLHCSLVAAQTIPNFRTRVIDGEPWIYDVVHGGSAVSRPDETIGFARYSYHADVHAFVTAAQREMERVRQRTDLERDADPGLIRYSVLPWMDFTSISHARQFRKPDSAPLITFGKITEAQGRRSMPVSVHVHHGLADGLHVARFVEAFQARLDVPESWLERV